MEGPWEEQQGPPKGRTSRVKRKAQEIWVFECRLGKKKATAMLVGCTSCGWGAAWGPHWAPNIETREALMVCRQQPSVYHSKQQKEETINRKKERKRST